MDGLSRRCVLDPEYFDRQLQVDAVAEHRLLHDLCGIAVLSHQHVGGHVEERDPAAKAGKALGELATDRPAADDAQSRRQLGEGKDGLVGEITALVAARYGWGEGPGTGGDDRSAETESLAVDLDGIRGDKMTLTDKDVDSQIVKPLGAVVTTDTGPQSAHPLHDGTKISLARYLGPTKLLGGALGFVPGTSGADDSF